MSIETLDMRSVGSAVIVALLVFVLDLQVELGVAAAVGYVVVIWLASYSERAGLILVAAIACSVLTLIGFVFSPSGGGELWKTVANRGLALFVVWSTAILLRERVDSERNRARLAAIVESSNDAILGTAIDGRVTAWNLGAQALFGYGVDEIMGEPISRLAPPDRVDEVTGILEKVRSNRLVRNFETVRIRKDGTPVDIAITVSPIRNTRGQVAGVSTIARDITERKRLEETRNRLNEQLAASNEALTQSNIELQQFAYVASHDLQEPLRHISGFVQLLQRKLGGTLGEEADQWIANTVRGVEQMQTLIRDLLAFSKVESRSKPFSPVALGEILDSSLEVLSTSLADTDAEVTAEELPTVAADASQMLQLMENLIGNAIKYHGEGKPRVHVSAERNGKDWIVSVKDNGIGIHPRHHERIFDIFRRLHAQNEYPGTGIGLAVCRRIVQRHGGRVWVDSEPGRGSTFCFTIPQGSNEAP